MDQAAEADADKDHEQEANHAEHAVRLSPRGIPRVKAPWGRMCANEGTSSDGEVGAGHARVPPPNPPVLRQEE